METSFVPPNAKEYRNVYDSELLFDEYPTDGREFEIKRQRKDEREPNKWNEML